MPKKSIDWNTKRTEDLFGAILALKTKDECRRFFRDLCTLEEVADMADRWQMVKLIIKNMSYRDISDKLKVSTSQHDNCCSGGSLVELWRRRLSVNS